MSHVAQAKQIFDPLDCGLVVAREYLIDVTNDSLDIRGTVNRHVFSDGLKVLPEIATWISTLVTSITRTRTE